MSADDRATVNSKAATIFVNSSSLPLRGFSTEASYDGTIYHLVRGNLILPSRERAFITLSTVNIAKILSVTVFGALFLAAVLALLLGCAKPEIPLTAKAPAKGVVAEEQPADTVPLAAPLRMAFLQDKTGSSLGTRTPVLTTAQLRRAAHLCRRHGGEITLGLIRDESNSLFIRLTIEPPPIAPRKAEVHETNPIARQAARRAAEQNYKVDTAAYEKKYADWQRSVAERENVFLADAERLLADAPDANNTDVNGGVSRADLFLAEDDGFFGRRTRRYLVVISDGIDNVRKPAPKLSSDATLVLVNGIGSVGSLAELQPRRFENIDAALNFIASKEASDTSGPGGSEQEPR